MVPRFYAGIGSRQTPADVLDLITQLAGALASGGWTLRSGHARGADQAFEAGAGERSEIYLPWPDFELETRTIIGTVITSPIELGQAAYEIAARYHPYWDHLKPGARHLHARNVGQILGQDLQTPSGFVVCWTRDGSLDGCGRESGGTGQALRIASAYGIPVYNLARDDHRDLAVDVIHHQGAESA